MLDANVIGSARVARAFVPQKIRVAVEARTDPDFVIIARTDARACEGLDSALRRARRPIWWSSRR